ncbi:hypothetical protein MRBLWS13_002795 [Microbacterium sp. LWS13-1.2]|uniref:Uncharacterized protein n=1 Tax=Microbacterium sp. LWS13-1.2 TaxID=3135264 RepID=A0AAU6SE25_9MICO
MLDRRIAYRVAIFEPIYGTLVASAASNNIHHATGWTRSLDEEGGADWNVVNRDGLRAMTEIGLGAAQRGNFYREVDEFRRRWDGFSSRTRAGGSCKTTTGSL